MMIIRREIAGLLCLITGAVHAAGGGNWIYVTCSGKYNDENATAVSPVFYTNKDSDAGIELSFMKYLKANHDAFDYGTGDCTAWRNDDRDEAEDERNDSISTSKRYDFKILHTSYMR